MTKVTAIFDIGKTNKKFFLFDKDYKEVYRDYKIFDEIKDEDGFPSDDIHAIRAWAKQLFDDIIASEKFDVTAINFSTYGASLVHVDKNGEPLTALYNYVKPIPKDILEKFYSTHGGQEKLELETSSPASGMLNSGMQLFWIKETRPDVFKRIKYSMHLPQYMSFLFTGIPVSEYTSIGCHTMLWDYTKNDYHSWVYSETIDHKLAPIVDTEMSINMNYQGQRIMVGVGIHDSSAALLPYLKGDDSEFILLSTGTWSITLNPFNQDILTKELLDQNCLNYMTINGKGVMASRLFLGAEYKIQIDKLSQIFGKAPGYHKQINFDESIYQSVIIEEKPFFKFDALKMEREPVDEDRLNTLKDFEHAYHRLMYELLQLQVLSSKLAVGNSSIKKVYIDGGFADNDLFVKLVSYHFSNYKLRTSSTPLGSALGAAMVISDKEISKKFLREKYGIKKHNPLILSLTNNF